MKKARLIFYAIFGFFQLVQFLFTLYVDNQSENFQFLINMQRKIYLFKYASFIGLALIIVDVVWHLKEERDRRREKQRVQDENTSLKAKMFDLQEAAPKEPNPQPAGPGPHSHNQ